MHGMESVMQGRNCHRGRGGTCLLDLDRCKVNILLKQAHGLSRVLADAEKLALTYIHCNLYS